MRIDSENINDFIESQLSVWQLARKNYDDLMKVRRRPVSLGDFHAFAQCNPARIVSTAAKTDADSVRARKCFLCRENRPEEQIGGEWIPGWEFLVNPYPILPVHFTLPHLSHSPQTAIPADMAAMAENAPDLMFFYNGAKAGASAPDHLHCQAVLKSEIPLVRIIERLHTRDLPALVSSESLGADLPFLFFSAVIKPDRDGLLDFRKIISVKGRNSEGIPDPGLVNAYFWMDDSGLLRIAVIPRKAHRPDCYYRDDDSRITVSPGALDMAGLVVLPVERDFDRITPGILRAIYDQVAYSSLDDFLSAE